MMLQDIQYIEHTILAGINTNVSNAKDLRVSIELANIDQHKAVELFHQIQNYLGNEAENASLEPVGKTTENWRITI